MEKRDIKKYLLIAIILLLIYISYLIIKSFITTLIASAILAYISYPVYKKTEKLTKNKLLSAAIITLLITIIIIFPIVSIAKSIIKESILIYSSGNIEENINKTLSFISNTQYSDIIKDAIINFTEYIRKETSRILLSLPSKIFHFIITIYTTFAFLLVGETIIEKSRKLIPLKEKEKIIKNIGNTIYSIVYGLFATAILQFIISLIVFKIIGTKAALLLALTIGFLAFIPFLGPAVIWVPYTIIEILKQDYTTATILIVLGIILTFIETIVKTKITAHHAKLHPVIILIGTIGGIKLLGIVGLVAGPVVLSILVTITESYYNEIKNET